MNPVNFLEGLWTDPNAAAPTDPKTFNDFYNYIERIFGWADQVSQYYDTFQLMFYYYIVLVAVSFIFK